MGSLPPSLSAAVSLYLSLGILEDQGSQVEPQPPALYRLLPGPDSTEGVACGQCPQEGSDRQVHCHPAQVLQQEDAQDCHQRQPHRKDGPDQIIGDSVLYSSLQPSSTFMTMNLLMIYGIFLDLILTCAKLLC